MLDDEELVSWTEESCGAIIAAASAVPPETPVLSAGDWTMTDLVAHVSTGLAGWFPFNMSKPPGQGDLAAAMGSAPPIPDAFEDRLDYLREAVAEYVALAREMDLATPVEGFFVPATGRFWALRAATEFSVHAWDAQRAIGHQFDIPADAAATCVDETIRGFWPATVAMGKNGFMAAVEPPATPIRVVATDAGHSWRVEYRDGDIEVNATLELPDTTVSGTGHDLVLYQWGRIDLSDLATTGDAAAIAGWNLVAVAGI